METCLLKNEFQLFHCFNSFICLLLRFVHLQLCSIAKMVNSIFIMQLMLYVSIIVIEVIIVLYALYIEVFKSNIDFLASHVNAMFMISTVDSLYNLMKIFLISLVCERTMQEVRTQN